MTITPEESLTRGTAFLDEATENLTFDEYEWAFEEAWRGLAWTLNALRTPPSATLDLGPAGALPRPGTLRMLVPGLVLPRGTSRLVDRIESLLARHLDAPELPFESVERIVFDCWDIRDAVSKRVGLRDERLGDKLMLADVSPGKVGSQVIKRRTALKLLAVGSILPLQACTKIERDNRAVASPVTSTEPAAAATKAPKATIARTSPIRGMHFETSDPFLFCAHHHDKYPVGNAELGPAESLEGRQLGRDFAEHLPWRMYHGRTVPGFPRHPHRGFETVTVVRQGRLDHADSLGAAARYGSGDVQWLTAGAGIQHAEMFPLLRDDAPNPLELFQIWVNLPRNNKMVAPHFTMLWNEQIPRVTVRDAAGRTAVVTVSAGEFRGERPPAPPPDSWASDPASDLAIWTVLLSPGVQLELPAVQPGTERSLYVVRGSSVTIAGQQVHGAQRVQFAEHGTIDIANGDDESELLLLQGRPLNEPVAKRGPFVMNTQQEIREAYADYQRTQFGGWQWRSDGPVHSSNKDRFAQHIDGRYEEPT